MRCKLGMTKETTAGKTTTGTMMVGPGTVVMTLINLAQDPTTSVGPQHQKRTPLLVSIYTNLHPLPSSTKRSHRPA